MISNPQIKSIAFDCITENEKELLLKWRNDWRIFKWCRQNDLINSEEHDNWFKSFQKDKSIRMYLIRGPENKPSGVCGLTSIDLINQRAEFSLYIDPESQGHKLGPSALKLLLWHGFSAYPLNIIWGETYDGNPALSMFLEAGFKKEGFRRDFYFREGKFIGAHLLSIKKDEFYL